ncbi:hypothetical protein [Serinicoccus sp. LYQ131]|uniref:hypothetical protein n=1 Tax=Serinicoccus sp. LYQ131 TaxID=3378797 RepID=UPI003851B58D
MSEGQAEQKTRSQRRDLVELVVGWALLTGGLIAALMWLPTALLPGGFILIDAPTASEALSVGVWSGTVAVALLLLGVSGVVLGLGVLHGGRAGLNRSLTWVAFGVAAMAALSQQAWLLSAGALAALATVLIALRQPVPPQLPAAHPRGMSSRK